MQQLRNHYLARAKGAQHVAAAAHLAFDLMQDDPANFKQGYTFDNAILAALDVFDTVGKAEVEHATRELLGKAIGEREAFARRVEQARR